MKEIVKKIEKEIDDLFIENALKLEAFEIIKSKMVNVFVLMKCISEWDEEDKEDGTYCGMECYNAAISGRSSALVPQGTCDLTEYEYDVLKEVLKK